MNRVSAFIFITALILISAFIIPTSAFASTYTKQTTSKSGIFQSISSFFSFFEKNNDLNFIHNDTNHLENNNKDKNDWFESFLNWFCDGNKNGDKDYNDCSKEKWNWGNDDGCVSSDEIWREWYCN